MIKTFLKLLLTIAYIGYLPAPGTIASVATASLIAASHYFFSPALANSLTFSLAILSFFLGKMFGSYGEKFLFFKSDPKEIVIDEVCGMALALSFLPYQNKKEFFLLLCLSLLLFRIFDIQKPFFIKKIERLKNGWGIMLDDVVSGALTWICIFPLALWLQTNPIL